MNERIRELWDRAAESAAAYPSGANNSWETQVDFMDKFAQLIVRECMKIVNAQRDALSADSDDWNDSDFGYDSALDDANIMIKQHFGVEE